MLRSRLLGLKRKFPKVGGDEPDGLVSRGTTPVNEDMRAYSAAAEERRVSGENSLSTVED